MPAALGRRITSLLERSRLDRDLPLVEVGQCPRQTLRRFWIGPAVLFDESNEHQRMRYPRLRLLLLGRTTREHQLLHQRRRRHRISDAKSLDEAVVASHLLEIMRVSSQLAAQATTATSRYRDTASRYVFHVGTSRGLVQARGGSNRARATIVLSTPTG